MNGSQGGYWIFQEGEGFLRSQTFKGMYDFREMWKEGIRQNALSWDDSFWKKIIAKV